VHFGDQPQHAEMDVGLLNVAVVELCQSVQDDASAREESVGQPRGERYPQPVDLYSEALKLNEMAPSTVQSVEMTGL
jgi:hypothetical protein